jgi:predicted membrane protein
MKNYNKQSGMTMVTIAAALALLAFFVLIAITLFPVYMENFSVSSHVARLANDPRAKEMTKQELRKSLIKKLGIDDVKNVAREDIIISEISGGYSIEVDYEVRKPFLGNVDLVIYFTETAEVK